MTMKQIIFMFIEHTQSQVCIIYVINIGLLFLLGPVTFMLKVLKKILKKCPIISYYDLVMQ